MSADNVTSTTITLTLEDALGRPTPGKLTALSQGSGHSLISGPNPGVTNSNGQVTFTAVDEVAETVTYTASGHHRRSAIPRFCYGTVYKQCSK